MTGSDPNHERFMRAALVEAEAAGEAGQLPIGALLVLDGQVVSRGQNCYLEQESLDLIARYDRELLAFLQG